MNAQSPLARCLLLMLALLASGAVLAEEVSPGGAPELRLPDPALALPPAGQSPFAQSLEAPPDPLFQPPGLPVMEEVPTEILNAQPPPPKPSPNPWSARFEAGLNGSEGNSQKFNTRTTVKLKRKTTRRIHTFNLDYLNSRADGIKVQNQLLLDGRCEALHPLSPWSYFLHGTSTFDRFTAYDALVTADTGVGFFFVNDDTTELQIRLGGGASREFGIQNAETIPEASYGFSFEHKLSSKQVFTINGDMFPDVRDFTDYRARGEVAWDVIIDSTEHLSLRLSVLDRYDSTPDGRAVNVTNPKRHNDINYTAQLAWSF